MSHHLNYRFIQYIDNSGYAPTNCNNFYGAYKKQKCQHYVKVKVSKNTLNWFKFGFLKRHFNIFQNNIFINFSLIEGYKSTEKNLILMYRKF